MGLSSTVPIQFYLGNGSSTVFSFPNEFFSAADLNVYLFDTVYGIIYPQQLGPNYTVSGPTNYQGAYLNGGNVTVNSAFPSTTELIIFRNPSPVQNFNQATNQPINGLALTSQLDYITSLIQALQYQQSQSLQLPLGTGQINGSSFSMQLPSTMGLGSSALMFLQVNSGATGWQLGSLTGSSSGGGGGTITGSVSLTSQVSGILPFANGGTNYGGTYSISGLIFASSGQEFFSVPPGLPGQFLSFQGSSAPTWATVSGTGSTSLTSQVSGILPLANGGTNAVGPYSMSAVIYGSGGAQFASVPPGFPGQVLTFQGSSAPNWSSVSASGSTSLTSQVSGILPTANGGTNNAGPYQLAGIIFASTATQFAAVPPGTPGQVLTFQGSSTPTWATVAAGSVSLTTGVTGILPITSGGTGASSSVFNALSPITGGGQIITGTGSPITNYALPAGAGGQFLQQNGASNGLQWTTLVAGSGTIITLVTTTCSMVVSSATNMVVCNSGAMTLTLPSVSGNSGISLKVKKADPGAGIITIVASSATSFIDGTSQLLIGQYEQIEMVCDGANWQVLDRYYTPVSMRWTAGSCVVGGGFSTVTWRTNSYDIYGLMSGSTGIITVNRPGKWKFESAVTISQTGVASDLSEAAIFLNCSQISTFQIGAATNFNSQTLAFVDTLNLNLNDQLRVCVADSSTTPSITTNSSAGWITMTYIGQ